MAKTRREFQPPQADTSHGLAHQATCGPALVLFVIFYFVYLVNASSLRIGWVDWENIRTVLGLHGWEGFRKIVLNHWTGAPRVQFLSWLLYAALAKLFGYWTAPYYAVLLGAHFLSTLLIYRILRELEWNEVTARGAAALCMVFPTAAGALFVSNNMFFVLPVSALLFVVWRLLRPATNRWADLGVLSTACLACQFLGEQTVPLLYGVLLLFSLREITRHPSNEGAYRILRIAVPGGVSAAALAAYWIAAVRPFAGTYPFAWKTEVALSFTKSFLSWNLDSLNFAGWMFGSMSLQPSAETVILAPAIGLALWALFFRSQCEPEPRPPFRAFSVLALAASLFAVLAPILYSGLTGYRADVETRYLYCSGLIIAVLVALALETLSLLWPEPTALTVRKWLMFAAATYSAILMTYDLRDIWGTQKRVDEFVWKSIDSIFPPRQMYKWERVANPKAKYLITDGLQDFILMPPKRSNAMGDFHEDFGVFGRMRAVNRVGLTIVRRPRGERGNTVLLQPYRQPPVFVDKAEIVAVVFRYGATYADLLNGHVLAFANYDDYKRYRELEGIRFNE